MSLADVLAVVLGLSVTAYAACAGTDLGAGILDLASGHRDGERAALASVIGPLWEANHVWLILSITILFAGFPAAFAAAGTALLLPLTIALLALVVRGAAFGARASAERGTRSHRRLGRLFGVASAIATFAFGAIAGGIAQISTARSGAHASAAVPSVPWTDAFSVATGLLGVAVCAHLGATFTTARLARAGDRRLMASFARRGIRTGITTAVLSAAGVAVAALQSPTLAHRLHDRAAPLLIVGLLAASASPVLLSRGRWAGARLAALLTVAMLVWGWFAAQSPRLIGPQLTFHNAAASSSALTAVCIAIAVVLVAVLPALYLLFAVFARPSPEVTK